MKNAWVALVCTLGAVACGNDNRPAQSPSTTSSTSTDTSTGTTETMTGSSTTSSGTGTGTTSTTPGSTMGTSGRDTSSMPRSDTTSTPHGTTGSPGSMGTTGSTTTTGSGGSAQPTTGAGAGAPVRDNPGSANATRDADNTKINDRDRHGAATAMDQSNKKSDVDITAAIRRMVVADKDLSFTAKNIKIITNGGKVQLRGPVKSDQEKSAIEAKAKTAPGVTEVDNQLEVKK